MPVSVRTFATPAEAAAALSSDRSARYIAGGTLVMRALNEGDVSIATIVRLEDRALTQIRASGARITIGAGVTLAQILRERLGPLAFHRLLNRFVLDLTDLIVAARGALSSLMTEVIEDHIRLHVVDPQKDAERSRGADELIEAVQAYLR